MIWLILGPVLAYLLLLIGCSLLVSPRKEYTKESPLYRFLLCSSTAAALKLLRVRVHVTGMEKLPRGERLLFVSNHRSNFDPIITWHALKPWHIAFVSKQENFRIPIFGRIIRKCCFLVIDRENPRKALSTIHKAAGLLENKEVSVGIYPEGTRSRTGGLLAFHNGVFKIAQKAHAPLAVLCVTGTEQIHRRTPFQRTDVYLDVLEVFPAETIRDTKTQLLGTAVRELLKTNIEKRNQ